METHFITDAATLRAELKAAVKDAVEATIPKAFRETQLPEWVSPKQAQDAFGLSARQLTYMREKGTVEYTQHGRRILYNRDSLEEWIEAGRVKAKRNGT